VGHLWAIFGCMGDWTIYAVGAAALGISGVMLVVLWFL
jgi:hypothetical protein